MPEPVPPLVHFIFGLSDEPSQRDFAFSHYLAIRAAHVHLQPTRIRFHYHHSPQGKWWDHAVPLLDLERVDIPREIFGRSLAHAAHRADVLRLRLLIEHGGIYLDLDVLVLRPFGPLIEDGEQIDVLNRRVSQPSSRQVHTFGIVGVSF